MPPRWSLAGVLAVPAAFAALKLALELAVVGNYGWFRDELYYIACSRHLAWGYVDHPPLSLALLALNRALFGDSLLALRWLPAVTGAATVLITGLLVRELGGRRFAQALACLCVVLAPVYLILDHLFSMNTFDQLLWALGTLLLVRALKHGRPAIWVGLGVVLGLGLLNKISMMWFGGALVIGLVFTRHQRALLTRGPWLTALVALVLFAPHILWQVSNGWPTLEFMRNATREKMVRTPFPAFWLQQLLAMGPITALVWISGLVWLMVSRRWRILGIMFIAIAAFLVAGGSSRPNYLTVAYPMLLAAGGTALEGLTAGRGRTWARWAIVAAIVVLGVPVMPAGLPILPVDQQVAYLQATGMRPRTQEHSAEGDLPQHFADMFGWEDLARRVAAVYHALPAEDRARCAIMGNNYGEAGAIDFFGPRHGLPPAISGHNNYWLWGPRGATGEVMILVGGPRGDTHSDFRSVVLADTTACGHCMPYENGAPILVCRGLNVPLAQRWPGVRDYE